MRYCQLITTTHPLSQRFPLHLESINTIIQNEGGNNLPFANEVAINLDKVKEASENTDVTRMKSMDMVLGMRDNNNRTSSLLVEFKLNCNNVANLSEGELRDKIKHSKILLFGSGIPIHNKFVFVFNDNLINVSRRIISYKLTNANGEALSIDELRLNYF